MIWVLDGLNGLKVGLGDGQRMRASLSPKGKKEKIEGGIRRMLKKTH
jgi:hypothetical protein